MNKTIVIPGSFDPVTRGHLDVIERCTKISDHILVLVAINPQKNYLFNLTERVELLREATALWPNVEIRPNEGLTVAHLDAKQHVLVKGIRNARDWDYELEQAKWNHEIAQIETLFLPTSPRYSHISSSLVKELAQIGVDLSGALTEPVAQALRQKIGGEKEGSHD